jgi:catechol 2,3-dioxygenase-like lactoylglutathione lyase family enzyme
MIGYVTVGTKDLPRAAAFYDQLLAGMGAKRFMEMERFVAWGNSPNAAGFAIAVPFDGNTATVGNGNMTALVVDSPAKVDALYAKAIELGATCEGKPGARSPQFYAAYFRDLDGNKLNFFCMNAQ